MIRTATTMKVLVAVLFVAIAPVWSGDTRQFKSDPRVLAALSIDSAAVLHQARCETYVAGSKDEPDPCTYVQTADGIWFLEYGRMKKKLDVKRQYRLDQIESVALQRFGLNRQIQLRLRDDPAVLAFSAGGTMLTDPRATEALYESLIASGVRAGEPSAWISSPTTVVVPVY